MRELKAAKSGFILRVSKVALKRETQGTETSKYLQEEKEKSIPWVVASEKGRAQTRFIWGRGLHKALN